MENLPTDDQIFVSIDPITYPSLAIYPPERIGPMVRALMISEQARLHTVLTNLELDLRSPL